MKLLGMMIVLIFVTSAAIPALAQVIDDNQIETMFELLMDKRECSGPADCPAGKICWTPGICIQAKCEKDSDCAMGVRCSSGGWCNYGE